MAKAERSASGAGSSKKKTSKKTTSKKTTTKKATTKKATTKKKVAKASSSRKKTTKKAAASDASDADTATPEATEPTPRPAKKSTRRKTTRKKVAPAELVSDEASVPVAEVAKAEVREKDEPRSSREGDDREGTRHGDGDGEGGGQKKRRRRRRRRGRGGGGGEGDGEARDGRDRPQRDDEGERPRGDAPAKERKRAASPEKGEVEHWEEIFEETTFADLGLRNSVLKGTDHAGFKYPTKIQSQLIPLMLSGKDVLGQSRTGTGKTAAFGLPLFNNATRNLPFQTIVMAPTRELAIQIARELSELGQFTPIKVCAVYGGSSMDKQRRDLERGPEIIVATPGRLWDVYQRGMLHFHDVKFVVLDEVDRMLDIGFREDIKQILRQIKSDHQTVFVSATISDEIEKLSRSFMNDPDKIVTTGSSLTVSMVRQHYITVDMWDKRRMLLHVLKHEEQDLTLVFCNMKRTVDSVARFLERNGIETHAIHGDMPQGKRNAIMNRLRGGHLEVLICSDLAARGLDVDGVSHVVNFDLPDDSEVYIHRVGRTARAGRDGVAWSLVTPEDGPKLTEIEMLANVHIPELKYDDFKPGDPPDNIREQQEADRQRRERAQARSRFQASGGGASAKVVAQPSESKFPDGIVPAKMPPKRLGGRVRTARSMKREAAPPPPPKED